MAAPNVNGRLHLTGVPPKTFSFFRTEAVYYITSVFYTVYIRSHIKKQFFKFNASFIVMPNVKGVTCCLKGCK